MCDFHVSVVSVYLHPSIASDTRTVPNVIGLHIPDTPFLFEERPLAGRDPAQFTDSRMPRVRFYGSLEQN
jgi:hypothetical protein